MADRAAHEAQFLSRLTPERLLHLASEDLRTIVRDSQGGDTTLRDVHLLDGAVRIAWDLRGTRIYAELRADDIRVGRESMARPMREAGIAGVGRAGAGPSATTIRAPERTSAEDLVHRDFTADGPNEFWDETLLAIGSRTMVE